MKAGMGLPKVVGVMLIFLLIYQNPKNQAYGQSTEELMDEKQLDIHEREKRETATSNSFHHEIEITLNTSDLDLLRTILNTLSFPLHIDELEIEITSIDLTTVCSRPVDAYQCRCEQNFTWSFEDCITFGSCDAFTGDTCGCINAFPEDRPLCQLNTNQTVLTQVDLVIEIPNAPPNFFNKFRVILEDIHFPFQVTDSVKVVDLIFTTGCYPNANGSLQCQCEELFLWPCEKCTIYGACVDAAGETCDCINAFPSDGHFCEPITNITHCPTPTPVVSTTPTSLTPTPTPTPTSVMATPTPTSVTPTPTSVKPTPTPTSVTPTPTSVKPTPSVTPTPTSVKPTPSVTPTPTPVTPTPMEENLTITLELDFSTEYNDPDNEVFKTTNDIIQTQSKEHISTLQSAELTEFRSGSTVALYTVRATAFQEGEIADTNVGIITQMSNIYGIRIDDGSTLKFEPSQVFFGESVNVTCGPPPAFFNPNWISEWRRNDQLIQEDAGHIFLNTEGQANLTVSDFNVFDNGRYECKLKDGNVTFIQRSDGEFTVSQTPLIFVSPISVKVDCTAPKEVQLTCSVNSPYEVEFVEESAPGQTITLSFSISNCDSERVKFTCQEKDNPQFFKEITLELSQENFVCVNDPVFGDGVIGDRAVGPCEQNEVGQKIAVCREDGEWEEQLDLCVLQVIQELLELSQDLNNITLPVFLDTLREATSNFTDEVLESPATITAISQILSGVVNTTITFSIRLTRTNMENILITSGVLTLDAGQESWDFLNRNDTRNPLATRTSIPNTESVSSRFLLSLEILTAALVSDSFDIDTPQILLNKTSFNDTFNGNLNSSVEIDIPESEGGEKSLTLITFRSMDNVLPPRDEDNSSFLFINGRVVLVQSSGNITNVSFTFDILNDTLRRPQCVFWNFSLFDDLGGWDSEGCELVLNVNQTVSCSCNHLTSFSILMSPFGFSDPGLDILTFVGVGISMASLVICLIIEAIVWKKVNKNDTSYLRHVSIVNIAVCLLVANIWFIIGAAISDPENQNLSACSAATFFIHFFYLALFFWMLASALLLLYRAVSVFAHLSKRVMLAIGFSIGYIGPLLIAIITIAVTAPSEEYTRRNGVCWLNWVESKALLAFVIPALIIVVINIAILFVVLYKILRRRVVASAEQEAERHVLMVIARMLAVLAPFFGLTWGLGVGTMLNPFNRGIHIAFAFFNSLQGFFILLFGTLLDKKVRSALVIPALASCTGKRSTSVTDSSSSVFGFWRNWKRRRGTDGYNVSSNASGVSQSNNT